MSHNSNSEINIPLNEKFKSLPGFFGIHLEEQAPYDVLKSDAGIEIRCYRPQARAKISVISQDYNEAYKEAFNALASYIFGDNQNSEHIEMTTPILMEEHSEKKEWVMFFILPQQYILRSAPEPVNKRIEIVERPVHLIASISYAGLNNRDKIEEHTSILKKWLKKRPWYILDSEFKTAQYDGPLTIPFFRKNEIHIEVKHYH